MKKVLIAIAAIFTIIPAIAGEGNRNPEDKATKFMEVMSERVELTGGQQTGLTDIMTAHFTEVFTLRDQYGRDDFEAMKTEMDALRDELHNEASAILDEGQVKAMKTIMVEMKEKREKQRTMKDMTTEERHEVMITKMDEALELTDAQEEEIRAILNSKVESINNIKEQADKNKEAGKTLMEQVNSEISAVLDPEQATKFAEMKEKHRH
jgi:hypothetical protein